MNAEPSTRQPDVSRALDPRETLRTMDNCTKCGICQAYCPVAAVTVDFPGPKYTGPQAQRFRAIEQTYETSPWLCSGCGVCTSVCPNEVAITDIITIAKAESIRRGHQAPLGQRLLNRPELVGRIAGFTPWLSNALLSSRLLRRIVERSMGIDRDAPLPKIHGPVFRQWFKKQPQPNGPRLTYFTGCAVENYDPDVGIAVVRVLNRLGYRVEAPTRSCCSLPMLSSGEWAPAEARARRLIDELAPSAATASAIVSSSTSCSLTLQSKYATYLELTDRVSRQVACAVVDICGFLRDGHIERLATELYPIRRKILYHGPCQLRSHQIGLPALEILRCIEGLEVEISRAVCCGVGGTYGYDCDKHHIAESIAQALLHQIQESKPDLVVCDSETCRWHIAAQSGLPCFHPLEIVLASLDRRDPIMDKRANRDPPT